MDSIERGYAGNDKVGADLNSVVVEQIKMNLIVVGIGENGVIELAVIGIGDGCYREVVGA